MFNGQGNTSNGDRTGNTGDRDVNTTDDNNEDDDDGSEDEVAMFMNGTCNCTMFEGGPCSKLVSVNVVQQYRFSSTELTHHELDPVLLGKLAACTRYEEGMQRQNVSFMHSGHTICRKMFLFFHTIHEKRFKNLMKHLKLVGVTPRTIKHKVMIWRTLVVVSAKL